MKMAPTCALVRRACSSVVLLHNSRRSSTGSAMDHAARTISAFERPLSPASHRDQALPSLPVPDGFPFSIEVGCREIAFIREDKDELTEISLRWKACHVANNGSPCSPNTCIYIRRGHWYMRLRALNGSKTLRIQEAYMSEDPKGNLKGVGEYLDLRGIDARKIADLFKEQILENKGIDA